MRFPHVSAKARALLSPLAIAMLFASCSSALSSSASSNSSTAGSTSSSTSGADSQNIAHGADISWLSQLEANGVSWVDSSGTKTDAISLLSNLGVDSIRLRVMVNPGGSNYEVLSNGSVTGLLGYCDQAGMIALAKRCKAAGISKFLVDFHFSDTWADASHQSVPAAWASDTTVAALASHLSSHVTTVLTALVSAGITPTWVQLGNEIYHGILWGSSATGYVSGSSGWSNLATLLNAGYSAVKAVNSSILVVIHLDRGGENSYFRGWFDSFKAAGGEWDVTGMSFYPYWQPNDTVAMLSANMADMLSRYNKPVMVCEVGGQASDPSGTATLISEVKAAVAAVSGNQGLGLFYWEPEAASSYVYGYALGASKVYATNQLQFTSGLSTLGYGK